MAQNNKINLDEENIDINADIDSKEITQEEKTQQNVEKLKR